MHLKILHLNSLFLFHFAIPSVILEISAPYLVVAGVQIKNNNSLNRKSLANDNILNSFFPDKKMRMFAVKYFYN